MYREWSQYAYSRHPEWPLRMIAIHNWRCRRHIGVFQNSPRGFFLGRARHSRHSRHAIPDIAGMPLLGLLLLRPLRGRGLDTVEDVVCNVIGPRIPARVPHRLRSPARGVAADERVSRRRTSDMNDACPLWQTWADARILRIRRHMPGMWRVSQCDLAIAFGTIPTIS